MTAQDHLSKGDVDAALGALQAQVRAAPADPRLRVFLYQLLLVLGQWDRALTQLSVATEMDASRAMLARADRAAIQCEALRAAVFAGTRAPLVLGEPDPWVAWMIQAAQMDGQGRYAPAAQLRAKAFEEAPAVPGTLNGAPFQWLADADSRLGPILEAFVDAGYYWIPLHRIASIAITPPTSLRDAVWLTAEITLVGGGEKSVLIPSRYPGSEASADGAVRLARRTEWRSPGEAPDTHLGLGQRTLVTDLDQHPLLEITRIDLSPAG